MSGFGRHYLRVCGRRVHLRVGGAGPLILLLHQSPQSSADFTDFMLRWGHRFGMIAPDRPGCGLSEPLSIAAPDFGDYADALAKLLDALGIERVAVYGFHTGATEALALAARHPSRVSAVVANGVVALTEGELVDIEANYLPPIEPSWDGGHLAWIWSRMREQTIFFPWHRRTVEARLEYDVPPPERLQRNAIEMMDAFDRYSIAYRAAFRFDANAALVNSDCPVLVTAAKWDPLFAHLARLESTRAGVTVCEGGAALDVESAALDWLAPFAAVEWSMTTPGDEEDPIFVASDGGSVHCERRGPTGGRRVLLIHDAGECARLHEPLIARLAAAGLRVIAPDLPGHGESSPLPIEDGAVARRHAECLVEGPLSLESPPETIIGIGAGVGVAGHLVEMIGPTATLIALRPTMCDPSLADTGRILSSEQPRANWYGGHLQMAWHRVRSACLFQPWWDARSVRAITADLDLDPVAIHRRAAALLRSGADGPELAAAAIYQPLGPVPRLRSGRTVLVADERWPEAARQTLAALASDHGLYYDAWVEADDARRILALVGVGENQLRP